MSNWAAIRHRLSFLASAFNGDGGFRPQVGYSWGGNGRSEPSVTGPCELVRYGRESDTKFAARCAVATYENHLRQACERFVGYLGRKPPQREGCDSPLHQALLENADLAGSPLNVWMVSMALQTRARGCMLVLVRMPEGDLGPSLQAQLEQRAVPYLLAIHPERVVRYAIDRQGLLTLVAFEVAEQIEGRNEDVVHEWSADALRVFRADSTLLRTEPHPFGVCPVLALTENGQPFPQIGKYAQIADLSRRLFNARSELDEILRSQTFSLLTLQVPQEASASFDAQAAGATIGTHSMLVHSGTTPAFIAPDSGPAQVYLAVIEQLQQAISRIGMEAVTETGKFASSESGVARKLRFEALNADIATFSRQLQALERRIWALFSRALGLVDRTQGSWATDYNLADIAAELDILALMQAGGMPDAVLDAKRSSIVAAEFDAADEHLKAELQRVIEEGAHRRRAAAQEEPSTPQQKGQS